MHPDSACHSHIQRMFGKILELVWFFCKFVSARDKQEMPPIPPINSRPFIDVPRLSCIYNSTVATYKFYWFTSIINLVLKHADRSVFSFYEIIAGMISEAWYPIHYFRLSFGKSDSLEAKIIELQRILDISIDAKKEAVASTIMDNISRPQVRRCLEIFTYNVPYRFLSPWIPGCDAQVENLSREKFNNCPYSICGKEIFIDDFWREFLTLNAAILKDFTFWNLAAFLQKRNPNVPDIPSKLVRPIQRSSLVRQHRFWDRYISNSDNVRCIYTDAVLEPGEYDLDHFIPWSFVVHDLNWNLIPANPSINSSKSNNLPSLDRFLRPLAKIQQAALKLNIQLAPRDPVLEDYLVFRHSIDFLAGASEEQFYNLMKNEFEPMAQTAHNMGFTPWINIA